MVNKIKTEDEGLSYQPFRPEVVVDKIAALPERPGWTRKGVIMNYKHIPNNVLNHEKVGYQIVYTKETVKDNRKFSPDNNESGGTVMAPVFKTSADGYKYIVMEIENSKLEALKLKEAKDSEAKYQRSVKSIKKSGNTMKTDGGEIDI